MITTRLPIQICALLALVVLCYGTSLGHGFVFDDDHSIVDNPSLTALSAIPGYFVDASAFTGRPEHGVMYRPLVVTTLAINHAISGLQPWSYHLLNVLLHAVTCVLVWQLLRSWTGLPAVAWWLAALMAVHPAHSEIVNYVSARAGILATIGLLAAMILAPTFSLRGSAAVGFALLGGLLAKSTALLGIPLMLLRAVGRRGRHAGAWMGAVIAGAAAGVVYLAAATSSGFLGSSLSQLVRPLDVQLLTQTKVSIYYLWLIALPVHLSPVHAFQVAWEVTPTVVAAGGLLLSIVGLAVHQWWQRGNQAAYGVLWFYGSLGITFLMPLNVIVSEHRLYLPWVGLSLAAAWLVGHGGRLPDRRWFVVALVLLAALTVQRGQAWASEVTLWSAAARHSPQDPRVQTNLASGLLHADRTDEARRAYERALATDPSYTPAMSGLAHLHEQAGDNTAAEGFLRRALAIRPEWAELHRRLGALLLQRGAHEEAHQAMAAALRLDTSPDGLVRMGVAQRRQGDLVAARRSFEQALEMSPGLVDALVNLGGIQQEQAMAGTASSTELLAAQRLYEKALRLQPGHDEAQQNLIGLLGVLSTTQARAGDLAGAAQSLARLIELAGPTPTHAYNRAEVLTALGQQHLSAGDHDGANKLWREALGLYRQAGVDFRRSRQRIEMLDQQLR